MQYGLTGRIGQAALLVCGYQDCLWTITGSAVLAPYNSPSSRISRYHFPSAFCGLKKAGRNRQNCAACPHPAPLGGSGALIANTGWVTCRDESFAFFTFAFPWRATAVCCFFRCVIRFTSGRDQRPPPGIPPPTLRFSLSSSPESVPVHDIFISWPPT